MWTDLKWLDFSIGTHRFDWIWFSEDQRASIIKTRVKRDWVMSSNMKKCSTLNSGHD